MWVVIGVLLRVLQVMIRMTLRIPVSITPSRVLHELGRRATTVCQRQFCDKSRCAKQLIASSVQQEALFGSQQIVPNFAFGRSRLGKGMPVFNLGTRSKFHKAQEQHRTL